MSAGSSAKKNPRTPDENEFDHLPRGQQASDSGDSEGATLLLLPIDVCAAQQQFAAACGKVSDVLRDAAFPMAAPKTRYDHLREDHFLKALGSIPDLVTETVQAFISPRSWSCGKCARKFNHQARSYRCYNCNPMLIYCASCDVKRHSEPDLQHHSRQVHVVHYYCGDAIVVMHVLSGFP